MTRKVNTWLLIAAAFLGGAAALSFAFHTGIAQNLSRLDKVLYILFAFIPFTLLFHLILQALILSRGKLRLRIFFLLAILISLALVFFAYPEVKPVRQHEISISLPPVAADGDALSLKITRAEVADLAIRNLALTQLHTTGNAEITRDGIVLSANSGVSLAAQYSGQLRIYFEASDCPLPIVVSVDGSILEQDACASAGESGLTFAETHSGRLTPRWVLLLRLFKGLDLVLFTFLSLGLMLLLEWVLSCIRQKTSRISDHNTKKEPRFLLTGVAVLTVVTLVVYLAGIFSVVFFTPLLLLLLFDYIFLYHHTAGRRPQWLLAAVMTFFIFAIALNISASQVYNQYLRPFPLSVQHRANSINALTITLFRGFDNSLFYGYDDVLKDRELIFSKETVETVDPDVALLSSRLRLTDLKIVENDPEVSAAGFDFLQSFSHRVWDDGQGYCYYFMDESVYQPGEAVVVRQYENWFLLLPFTVNQQLEEVK